MPVDRSRGTDDHGWEILEPSGDALRGAMRHFPTGVTVVTSGREERTEGMTANALISVSLDPLLFLVSVHRDARLNPRIREERYFAVNMLADDQEGLSRLFASPERSSGLQAIHSLGGGYGSTGAPLAAGAPAGGGCAREGIYSRGAHTTSLWAGSWPSGRATRAEARSSITKAATPPRNPRGTPASPAPSWTPPAAS